MRVHFMPKCVIHIIPVHHQTEVFVPFSLNEKNGTWRESIRPIDNRLSIYDLWVAARKKYVLSRKLRAFDKNANLFVDWRKGMFSPGRFEFIAKYFWSWTQLGRGLNQRARRALRS